MSKVTEDISKAMENPIIPLDFYVKPGGGSKYNACCIGIWDLLIVLEEMSPEVFREKLHDYCTKLVEDGRMRIVDQTYELIDE